MANIEQNVNLNFETNASEVKTEVDGLNKSLSNTNDLNVKQSGSTDDLTKKTGVSTNTFKANSTAVLENGGAMGLLNDLTGGYAMMVKDAVEASVLFISKKKADVVVTEAQTVATTTQTSSTWLATAAQEALNLAVSLNPYVLLATALVAVTAGLVYYVKTTNEAAEASARLDSAIYLATENTKKYADAVKEGQATRSADNDIEILRARQLGLSGKALDKYIEKLKAADLEEARIAASKAYRNVVNANSLVGQAIAGGDEKQVAAAKANQAQAVADYKTFNDTYNNAIVDGNRRREENNLKYYEADLAAQKTANDKKAALQKKAADEQANIAKQNDAVYEKAKLAAEVGVDEKAKELKALDELYKINFEDARYKEGKFSKELALITEQRNREIAIIEEKYRLLKSEADKKAKQEELDRAAGVAQSAAEKAGFAYSFKIREKATADFRESEFKIQQEYDNRKDDLDMDRRSAEAENKRLNVEGSVAYKNQLLEIDRYFANEELLIAEDKFLRLKDLEQSRIDASLEGAQMLLSSLTSINNDYMETQLNNAGDDEEKKDKIRRKAFENNKKLQLGIAVITGIQSGISAYAAGMALPPPIGGPVMGAIYAGISAVTTLAAIAKIASSKYGGNSGGASTGTSGGGGAAVATPSVTFQSSSDNQLASAVNKTQNTTPIKAYVVSSEITSAQELERKTTTSTSVG